MSNMQSKPEDISIERVAGTIAAMAWGDPEAPLILATHGWLDHAGSFAALAPYLCDDYRVVAIDFLGHGLSATSPPGFHYDFLDFVSDIEDVRAGLGATKLHLLGHSMGGALAMLYAAARPEYCLSLVSIDAMGPISEPAEKWGKRLQKGIAGRASEVPEGRWHGSREQAIKARKEAARMTRSATEILAERGLEERDGRFRWRGDRRHQLAGPYRLTEDQILSAMRLVACPTIVIEGEESHLAYPKPLVAPRKAALATATFAQLPGGHHLHLDHPQVVASTILEFLKGLDEPDT